MVSIYILAVFSVKVTVFTNYTAKGLKIQGILPQCFAQKKKAVPKHRFLKLKITW